MYQLLSLSKPEHCKQCYGWQWGSTGYVPADGSGENGVLVVLEAAGAEEAKAGVPTIGRAGHFLWSQLARVGIEREGFRIHNVLSCQPGPKNLLAKQPYEQEVIAHCAPLLDATISDMHKRCADNGKQFVILAVGRIAFKRILDLNEKSPILHESYINYPFWSEKYQAWVLSTHHPSYLMRGNNHLLPVLQFAFRRALEIAENGFAYHTPIYMKDPDPAIFVQWVKDFQRSAPQYLACDIETPHKQGQDEEKVSREDDDDYTILRCSFAYRPHEAVSVPWRAEYLPMLEELFASSCDKVFHNESYDVPRIKARLPIAGNILDNMLAWHVLNSALPKGLGFVTPFYCSDMPMWKHLSKDDPAGYNSQDSDATLRDFLGIKADLISNHLWPVFERHVVLLNQVLGYMSGKGVLRDETMRADAEMKLSALLADVEAKMDAAVPQEARRLKVYKRTPKDTSGMVQVERSQPVKRCSICGMERPPKSHFKAISERKAKLGLDNICSDAGEIVVQDEIVTLWAKPLEFKVSKVGLEGYQKALKHQAIVNWREQRITFDEGAIKQLIKRYPIDQLYPLILKQREYGKLLSTYIGITEEDGQVRGGMSIGEDGRIHPFYTHNPSTLRLACQSPNMQNLPRAKGPNDLQTIVRNLIIPQPGYIIGEWDFAAIEAVLLNYFAGSADGIRLAKLGIHSFLASHVLGRPADLKWSDDDLRIYFKEIKRSKDQHVQDVYNSSKRTTYLSGYGGTPRKMHLAEPEAFPTVKSAETLQGMYFDICPYVLKWQNATRLQAERDGFLKNPFGYIHRFYHVFKYYKENGKWKKKPDIDGDGNACLAFGPSSTASAIIKEVMLRLYFQLFEEAGQYLRLQVHDSLVNEVPLDKFEEVNHIMVTEMTRPIPELRLPASYKLGDMLSIDVESKSGFRWGSLA